MVFCGINPSLYSGAVGHHFARPGNRFWKALHGSGFTDRELSPFEDRELPRYGLGVTNLVGRATASAAELSTEELREGARRLEEKIRRYRAGTVAVVGVGAFRTAFSRPRAAVGHHEETLAGARLWILPNPSGRTAAYQLPRLVQVFRQLRESVL